jgi:D-alanyl-lipoteichoic acid acyltransferase DltB (MBOAT superfamily)
MLFSSYVYIFAFLPITFFIYFYLLEKKIIIAAKSFLVFVSLLFYTYLNIKYLPLILISILFNYAIGNAFADKGIEKVKIQKKVLLTTGIIANITLLGYFKYSDFFIENLNLVFDNSIPLLRIALPLAISFFTFQQIAFLVDSYRGKVQENDFLNYALFVTFFPQLIAGPIVYHAEIMPQFATKDNFIKNHKNIATGIFIFSIGLFKKIIVADTFAIWATKGFDQLEILNFIEGWLTSLSYTFQLYFDFSGYTDMAIGAAMLFNIKLPINFNSPYKALDIQDFWRRWHITFSRFLKDYIYVPLGGNRKSSVRTSTNLLTTFILGGIWHGAGWTFVFWGVLHGMALVTHRFWKPLRFAMPKLLAWFITFNFINIAWVFFRANDWNNAIKVLKGMFLTVPDFGVKIAILKTKESSDIYAFLILAFVITVFMRNSMQLSENFNPTKLHIAYTLVLLLSAMYFMHRPIKFLYFNF